MNRRVYLLLRFEIKRVRGMEREMLKKREIYRDREREGNHVPK